MKNLLHSKATPEALEFVYFWVFGIWMFIILNDPIPDLAYMPREIFNPTGFLLRFSPDWFKELFQLRVFLWGFKFIMLTACLGIIFNKGRKWFGLAMLPLLAIYQGLVRSFGHINHPEMMLVNAAYILIIFSFINWRSYSSKEDLVRLSGMPIVVIVFIFSLTYAFAGIHRLAVSGLEIFGTDTLEFWIIENGKRAREISWHLEGLILSHPWIYTILKIGYPVATVFEILAPFCLVSKKMRYAFIGFMVPFHISIWMFMGIFFWENLTLFLFYFDFTPWLSPRTTGTSKPIIFFDGICNLCNGFIDFLMKRDRTAIFQVASLQGKTAEHQLESFKLENKLGSVVLLDNGQIYKQSDAVIRILGALGGVYKLSALLFVVPKFIRNAGYELVAGWRYSLFGKRNVCRLPTKEESARFLS